MSETKGATDAFPEKFRSLQTLLGRPGVYARTAEGFVPNALKNWKKIQSCRILVVGAGGLGCEILKDLALSGFPEIHVIDLDTIDLSNLNRQFLFRKSDIGKPKAQVAAEFVMKRVKGVEVKWYQKKIQQFSPKWYTQFDYVIAGLDNIEARQWLNNLLVDLVEFDEDGDIDWDTCRPLIDGGTEGFGGQARVFVPHFTSCFECSLDSMPATRSYPECTIKHIPRLPEHCIMYALSVNWPLLLEFKNCTDYKVYEKKSEDDPSPNAVKLDTDDAEHLQWLMSRAEERAKQFGITGVTYPLTMQVVKNIIPAIASTNALISAACVNEVLKLRTLCAERLDNYWMYLGAVSTGINTQTTCYQKKPDCPTCHPRLILRLDPNAPLSTLVEKIRAKLEEGLEGQTVDPSVSLNSDILYDPKMPSTKENLARPLITFFQKPGAILSAAGGGKVQKTQVFWSS